MLDKSIEEIHDPEQHIDPVNILCQLDNDFYEKLESKKWQERKKGIDKLEGILAKSPKLENGEYGDLVRILKTVRNYIAMFLILKYLNSVLIILSFKFVVF